MQALLAAGLSDDAKIFEFIGYREMLAAVRGKMKLDEAREAIQLATRHYAKRQLTWFRKDPQIRWFAGAGDDAAVQQQAQAWLAEQLAATS